MRRLPVLLLAVLSVALTGCGDSGGGSGNASSGDASSAPATASKPGVSTLVARFKKCMRPVGAKLKSEPPTLKDRIAVGAAGNLPATYIGALVFRKGAYQDMWIADDAAHGAKTADLLNAAEARSEGVSEVEAAFSMGRAVGAPQNSPKFADLFGAQAQRADRCMKAIND